MKPKTNKTLHYIFLCQFILLAMLIASSANAEQRLIEEEWFSRVINTLTPTSTTSSGRTLYAKPFATAATCSEKNPCDLYTAASKAQAGDVVFLRGGIYPIQNNLFFSGGKQNALISYESYPGEWAILDGSSHARGARVHIRISNNYTAVRRLEIRNMPRQGIHIGSNYNIVEGLHVHGNALSGIQVFSAYEKFPYGEEGSYNLITNCLVHDNSDVGFFTDGLKNGGNADGISISSGDSNQVIQNRVYSNSDDGIDTWRSTNSYVAYNTVHDNGAGEGNGMGIKAGGLPPSNGTVVEFNLSYNNLKLGFTSNSGKGVKFYNNTSFNNGVAAFWAGGDTIIERNIGVGTVYTKNSIANNNSWQRPGTIKFESESPGAKGFMVPVKGSNFGDIGALTENKPPPPTGVHIQSQTNR